MKTILHNIITLLLISAMSFIVCGCVDDLKLPGPGGDLGEGTSVVEVTVDFDRSTSVDVSTRAGAIAKGDAIDGITDFHLVLYPRQGTFEDGATYKCIHVFHNGSFLPYDDGAVKLEGVKYELDDNRLNDETNLQNDKAGRLTFKIFLEAAYYYAYGVANIPDLDPATYPEVADRSRLGGITRKWEKNGSVNLKSNAEMFGIFSLEPNRSAYNNYDQSVGLRAGGSSMHCWLKRLASKLTVSFDGSELFDDVSIYVTQVKVHDIAKQCPLWGENVPGRLTMSDGMDKAANRYNIENGLIEDGGTIGVQEFPAGFRPLMMQYPHEPLHVCNQHSYLNLNNGKYTQGNSGEGHSHAETSFFFYENRQGTGDSKHQDADNNGKIDTPVWKEEEGDEGWKDKKPYGTWIEVKAYYRSANVSGEANLFQGEGPITFRFMLGNDADKDYNVDRNTHYKVTLCFKGYGNDVDWHIAYNENRGIYSTSPQHVSYLFNKEMPSTIRVIGQIDPSDPYLYATIIGSGTTTKVPGIPECSDDASYIAAQTYWRPWGDDSSDLYPNPDNKKDKQNRDIYYKGFGKQAGGTESVKDGPWNSFLTLRDVSRVRITPPEYEGLPSNAFSERDYKYNKDYYDNNCSGWARYDSRVTNGTTDDSGLSLGTYTVHPLKSGDETYGHVFNVTIHTRAKELVTGTGFTGNNPYSSFPRRACVRYSVKLLEPDGKTPKWHHLYVNYIQVRRIENPKGVWRRAGSTEPFHVTLMHRTGVEAESDYTEFKSEGKWSAEVVGSPIITLSTTTKGCGDNRPMNNVNKIEGAAGRPIDFRINFNGSQGFAAVKVRYHNYTCEHLIFCRNGYDDVRLTSDGPVWKTFNVYRFKEGRVPEYTTNPIDPGSLFRRGSFTAILDKSGESNPCPDYVYGPPGGSTPTNLEVWKMGASSESTSDWAGTANTSNTYVQDWTINDTQFQIADIEDYYTLATPDQPESALNFEISKAYGIVYADGATVTQGSHEIAQKYMHSYGNSSIYGMRGVIAYNINDYKQVFFPIGAAGHGRRKSVVGWTPAPKDKPGTLRYASRATYTDYSAESLLKDAPLFYDIFRRPGAIYWCKKRFSNVRDEGAKYDNPRKSSAFDMNYFTMGFEGFINGAAPSNISSESDALYLKTVKSTTTKGVRRKEVKNKKRR